MLDVLFPVACAVCGALGASPCASCIEILRRPPPLPAPSGVDRVFALLAYEGAGRELVARLKYRNARASIGWLARALAGLVPPGSVDAVTWVPTTGRRRRRRGFDQARLLAVALARELGRPCVPLLCRGPGLPQTGRSFAERRRRPDVRSTGRARVWAGAHVLVVDDVCTTGSTLAAAADALRAAGLASVTAAVAARTLRHGLVGRLLTRTPTGGRP